MLVDSVKPCMRVQPHPNNVQKHTPGQTNRSFDRIVQTVAVYIYIPATSTCAIFVPLSKEYKISAP